MKVSGLHVSVIRNLNGRNIKVWPKYSRIHSHLINHSINLVKEKVISS